MGVRVYIINGNVTINKIDDRSHCVYFMGYEANTGFIIYCNPYHTFFIRRSRHVWFDGYNSHVSIEDNHTPGYLILQQYPEILNHNSDLLNFIPRELDLTYTTFCGTTILTYEI